MIYKEYGPRVKEAKHLIYLYSMAFRRHNLAPHVTEIRSVVRAQRNAGPRSKAHSDWYFETLEVALTDFSQVNIFSIAMFAKLFLDETFNIESNSWEDPKTKWYDVRVDIVEDGDIRGAKLANAVTAVGGVMSHVKDYEGSCSLDRYDRLFWN